MKNSSCTSSDGFGKWYALKSDLVCSNKAVNYYCYKLHWCLPLCYYWTAMLLPHGATVYEFQRPSGLFGSLSLCKQRGTLNRAWRNQVIIVAVNLINISTHLLPFVVEILITFYQKKNQVVKYISQNFMWHFMLLNIYLKILCGISC